MYLSTVEPGTCLEVKELLARFCRYMDRGMSREWAGLFTEDGRFVSNDGGGVVLSGPEELVTLADIIHAKDGANIRHLLTAVTMETGANRRDLVVEAYGPVLDMAQNGAITRFYDLRFKLRRSQTSWHIAEVIAHRVGQDDRERVLEVG